MAATAEKSTRTRKAPPVIWRDPELVSMCVEEPEILTTNDAKRRLELVIKAQNKVLPKARRRSFDSLYICVVNSPEQWEKLAVRARAGIAALPPEKKTKSAKEIRWTKAKLARIAHDDEVVAMMSDAVGGRTSRSPMVDAVIRAQARQLPPDLWKTSESIHNDFRSHGLLDKLRSTRRLVARPENLAPSPRFEPTPLLKIVGRRAKARAVETAEAEAEANAEVVNEPVNAVSEPVVKAAAPIEQPASAEPQIIATPQMLAHAAIGASFEKMLAAAIGQAIRTEVAGGLKQAVADALAGMKLPTRESLLGDMEEMLVRLLGGPTQAPPPPPDPVPASTPEPMVASLPEPEPEPAPEPVQALVPAEPPPHDLTSQLEHAAKALGMEHAVKRPTVIVCGVHPRLMDEIEHVHGRSFRFCYVKQDHFNHAGDLPASTDALILSRKKLNSELMGTVRRYAIPMKSVANSLPAFEWALREIFPEKL